MVYKLFLNLACKITWSDWLTFFSRQSAALQKKLRHLEVQLNNDKQVKDELENKYRYRNWRNQLWQILLIYAFFKF